MKKWCIGLLVSLLLFKGDLVLGDKNRYLPQHKVIQIINATPFEVYIDKVVTCLLPFRDVLPTNKSGKFESAQRTYNGPQDKEALYCRQRPEAAGPIAPGMTKNIVMEKENTLFGSLNESIKLMRVTWGRNVTIYNPPYSYVYWANPLYIVAPPNKSFIKFVEFIQ